MKGLVFYDTPGQMCNRFWSYIDSVGWAIENKAKIYVLFWDNSIKDFDRLRRNKYIKFPFYSQMIIRIFGEEKYLNFLKLAFTNKYSRLIYRRLGSKFVEAVRSYERHNDHIYYPKHLSLIRDLFQPRESIRQRVDGRFKNWRGGGIFLLSRRIQWLCKKCCECS